MKRILTPLFLLSALVAGTGKLSAQTTVPSLITSDQVWNLSGSPYLINQNTYIAEGVSVRIMPGVQVISANTSIALQVDGELQGLGSVSSPILIDQLQIQLSAKAKPYNSTTDSGAYFNYCVFTSTGIGKQVMSINGTSARIENCTFLHAYYSVYVQSTSQSTILVEVLNSTFTDSTGMMYSLYSASTSADIVFSGNICTTTGYKGGGMYAYGANVEMVGNSFTGQDHVTVNAKNSDISCNYFYQLKTGVKVTVAGTDSLNKVIFTHNTLDSIGHAMINDPMLKVSNMMMPNLHHSRFNNNNFLTALGTSFKVLISGYNKVPTSFESIDFTDNYWVSTTPATIDGYIKDYNDDINIFGKADYTGFLSNIDTTCGDTSSCNASFYIAVDTSNPYNLYVVNNSTGTTVNTSYTWDFGDGNSSTLENPTHTYADFGVYYLCLTLYNALENCSSTYCDSIGLDSNGTLLKNGAFTVFVVNESDISSIDKKDDFGNVSIYPNPTGGKMIVELSEIGDEPITISVMDMTGRLVQEYRVGGSGAHRHLIDLSPLPEGFYLLTLQKSHEKHTTKIVISR